MAAPRALYGPALLAIVGAACLAAAARPAKPPPGGPWPEIPARQLWADLRDGGPSAVALPAREAPLPMPRAFGARLEEALAPWRSGLEASRDATARDAAIAGRALALPGAALLAASACLAWSLRARRRAEEAFAHAAQEARALHAEKDAAARAMKPAVPLTAPPPQPEAAAPEPLPAMRTPVPETGAGEDFFFLALAQQKGRLGSPAAN